MKLKKEDRLNFLKAIMITVLLSEMYFYPFDSDFRFSAGIIALNLIILLYDTFSFTKLAIVSGSIIVVFRIISSALVADIGIADAFMTHLPTLVFYTLFGVLHTFRKSYENRAQITLFLFLMAGIDIFANTTEAVIRGTISYKLLQLIVLVGIIRCVIAYGLYLVIKSNELYIKNLEHQKRYAQLNFLVSNVQTELFYLNKSQKDIEAVMSSSYNLYHSISEMPEYADMALEISRGVHEIKKDYSRVMAGFKAFIEGVEQEDTMKLKDAFSIIDANTKKLINELGKEDLINIVMKPKDDFNLKNYYALFTMINNLIINSIEAASQPIQIKVSEYSDENYVYFEVEDDGVGIDPDLIPFLFNPGFTTKFDATTGKASTGMGLSHVKSTLEGLSGQLDFKSQPNVITQFTMKIPKNKLVRRA